MHATTDRKALRRLTMQAKRTNGGRVTLPALSGVKIEAADGTLTLTATDLETTYVGQVDADVSEPGAVLLPARALDTLVSKMDGVRVTFDDQGDRVGLSDGQAELELRPMVLEDFPMRTMPMMDEAWSTPATIDADRLAAVHAAASTDQARPILRTVRFGDGEAVATDSYRAMRAELDGGTGWTALANADTVKAALAAKAGDTVTVEASDTHVRLTVGRHCWVGMQVEGTFPNYAQVWPDSHEATVTIDGTRLAKATDRIGAVGAGQANTPVMFGPNGAGVRLTVTNQEVGEASEKVPADIEGDAPDIAFNPAFLKAMAATMGEGMRVGLRDGLKPAVFFGDRIVGLLMPMRVS